MRSLISAARRRFASLLLASAALVVSAVAQAQEPDEGGEDLLVLSSTICGEKYYDTPRMSKCLQRQNAKADRWMRAVAESYARMAKEAMADLAHGGVPFDQVAQLRKSQTAFDLYRKESAELAGRTGLVGMGGRLMSAMAYFELTVERARFLLDTCNAPLNRKLTDKIDLKIVDWCQAGY